MSSPARDFIHRVGARRLTLLGLVAAALFFFGTSGSAEPPPYARGPYSVLLEDDAGNPLRTFRKDGTTFVLGAVGDRYNVRIENHGARRVEAVLSVDGRDAVSGNVGDYVHERGYIVPAYGSVVVTGFRQSLERAAAFRFSEPEASYSARVGTPENVGVIGVAFFPERRVTIPRPALRVPSPTWRAPWRPMDDERSASAAEPASPPSAAGEASSAPAPRAEAPAKSGRSAAADAYADSGGGYDKARRDRGAAAAPSRLGTEYGESTWSPVSEVSFTRQNYAHPDAVLSMRYDDADGLIARGIEVYPRYWAEDDSDVSAPQAFPVNNRFAAPPPGW